MKTDSNQPRPLPVCAAIIIKDGRILLTRRPAEKKMGNFWEFPGGKIEAGETPQHALKRELREELAIEIEVESLVRTVLHQYEWGEVEIQAYQCQWIGGTIRHLDVADHDWVLPAELVHYNILPADLPIIRELEEMAMKNLF